MNCIFKIWEVEMLTKLNIVNGIVKISLFLMCRLGANIIFNMYNWYIKAELILIYSFNQIH